jgi:hypothetical protein
VGAAGGRGSGAWVGSVCVCVCVLGPGDGKRACGGGANVLGPGTECHRSEQVERHVCAYAVRLQTCWRSIGFMQSRWRCGGGGGGGSGGCASSTSGDGSPMRVPSVRPCAVSRPCVPLAYK